MIDGRSSFIEGPSSHGVMAAFDGGDSGRTLNTELDLPSQAFIAAES